MKTQAQALYSDIEELGGQNPVDYVYNVMLPALQDTDDSGILEAVGYSRLFGLQYAGAIALRIERNRKEGKA